MKQARKELLRLLLARRVGLGQLWGGSSDSRVMGSQVVRAGGPGATDMTNSTGSNLGGAREGLGVVSGIFT